MRLPVRPEDQMLTRLEFTNYKALKCVTLELTPFHVLIGANDTGKTSILEVITALSRSVDHQLAAAFIGRWSGLGLVHQGMPGLSVSISAGPEPL